MSLDSVFKLSVIVSMIDQLTGPMSRVNSATDETVRKIDQLNDSFGNMTASGLGMTTIGAGITSAMAAPVDATFETKRALGELKSMGVEDFKVLEDAATSFSDTWAGTTKSEFLSAAIDIKGGIDSLTDEGVARYSEIAGITAKATGAATEEMTSLFATGYGIYKGYYDEMSDLQFAEMFSAGIADSIRIFKASGSSMAEAISGLGAAATTAQVPLEEQLTILGMLQATMSGGEAGTKYSAFLQSAANAGEKLKLPFLDANKQLRSMPELLALLRSKFGETIDAAEKMQIQEAFGSDEAVDLIDLLYNKTGSLQDNILTLYGSMGQGTAIAQEMATAINSTEPEQFAVLQQQIHNVTEDIGNLMLPTFNQVMSKTSEVVTRLGDWIGQHQELAKIILLTILTIGSLLAIVGLVTAGIGILGMTITRAVGLFGGLWSVVSSLPGLFLTLRIRAMYAGDAMRGAFRGIATAARVVVTSIARVAMGMAAFARQAILTAVRAMPGLIASTWAFTAALLANPVTWIVIGIVALIAAIILLWQNWSSVTSFLKSAWNSFVNGIIAGFNWVRNLFAGMPTWLQVAIAAFMPFIGIPMLIINNWGTITAFFSNLWNGIVQTFQNGLQRAKDIITGALGWFRESGSKVISTFSDGIKTMINKPAELVRSGLAKVRELLPFSDAHEGPLSQLTLSGRRVFETIGTGMEQSENVPAEMTDRAFARMDLSQKEPGKINLKEKFSEQHSTSSTSEREKGLHIENLNLSTDLNNLKDLKSLFKLLKEIEEYNNGNGETPSPA